jgi:uncharacterized protein (DUF4415 family)
MSKGNGPQQIPQSSADERCDCFAQRAIACRHPQFLMGGRNKSYLQRRCEAARHFSKACNDEREALQDAVRRRRSGRRRTDWHYRDCLTDDEIVAAVVRDRDAAPLDIDWSKAVVVVPPRKAISIRVDPDVLDFFKNEGPGYQRRINAVLRSYVGQKRGKSA